MYKEIRNILKHSTTDEQYSVNLILPGTVISDENTGVSSPGTDSTWILNAVDLSFDIKYIDGTTIKFGDKLVTIFPNDDTPEPDSRYKLTINSQVWNVLNCRPHSISGNPVTYELHLRL